MASRMFMLLPSPSPSPPPSPSSSPALSGRGVPYISSSNSSCIAKLHERRFPAPAATSDSVPSVRGFPMRIASHGASSPTTGIQVGFSGVKLEFWERDFVCGGDEECVGLGARSRVWDWLGWNSGLREGEGGCGGTWESCEIIDNSCRLCLILDMECGHSESSCMSMGDYLSPGFLLDIAVLISSSN